MNMRKAATIFGFLVAVTYPPVAASTEPNDDHFDCTRPYFRENLGIWQVPTQPPGDGSDTWSMLSYIAALDLQNTYKCIDQVISFTAVKPHYDSSLADHIAADRAEILSCSR